jgi:hypothetical protein
MLEVIALTEVKRQEGSFSVLMKPRALVRGSAYGCRVVVLEGLEGLSVVLSFGFLWVSLAGFSLLFLFSLCWCSFYILHVY